MGVLVSGILWFLPLILAVVAYRRVSVLRSEVDRLTARIEAASTPEQFQGVSVEPEVPVPCPPEPEPLEPQPEYWGVEVSAPRTPSRSVEDSAEPKPDRLRNFETQLTSRWLIWLAGLAFIGAAIFFVRHVYAAGLFPPMVRVASGVAIGLLAIAAGEFLRRKETRIPGPDYVPPAVTAGGLTAIFASIYAAHGL